MKVAEAGLAELQKQVDSLIVILNDKLMEVLGDDVSMDEAFRAADNVLRNASAALPRSSTSPVWSTSTSRTCAPSWARWVWR